MRREMNRSNAMKAPLLLTMFALAVNASAGELKPSIEQVRAYVLTECPIKAEPKIQGALAPIAAALIPNVVSAGIDMVAAALTAAGANKDTATTATATTMFYKSNGKTILERNPAFGCLVVEGNLYAPDALKSKEVSNVQWPQDKFPRTPRFYFQAYVAPDFSNGVFRLEPTVFRFAAAAEKSSIRDFFGTSESVSIAVSFTVPGAAQPFGSYIFTFPEQSLPYELESDALRHFGSGWMPVFPIASLASKAWEKELALKAAEDAVVAKANEKEPTPDTQEVKDAIAAYCKEFGAKKDAGAGAVAASANKGEGDAADDDKEKKSADEDKKASADKEADPLCDAKTLAVANIAQLRAAAGRAGDKAHLEKLRDKLQNDVKTSELGPTNVTVLVTETRYGSKFAAALGAALTASKQGLVDATKARLPAAQATAAQAALDAQDDNDVAALNALAAVGKAQAALEGLDANASAGARAEKEAQLRSAKVAANKAYRKAGRPEPYPGVMP